MLIFEPFSLETLQRVLPYLRDAGVACSDLPRVTALAQIIRPPRARRGSRRLFSSVPPYDISSASISKCRLAALVTVIVTVWVFASLDV